MEGLGRTLERWRSFGRSGFGIYGEELANRAGERKPLKLCPWRRGEEEDEQGRERTRARAAEMDKNVLDVGGSWEKGMNRPRRPARGDDPSDTRSRHGRWRDGALPLATTFPSTPARRGWLARGSARRENGEILHDGNAQKRGASGGVGARHREKHGEGGWRMTGGGHV